MNLASWSVRRVLGVWAAWTFVLALAVAIPLAVTVWRAWRASRHGDGSFGIAIPVAGARPAALLLFAPPLLFTLVWRWRRSTGRSVTT